MSTAAAKEKKTAAKRTTRATKRPRVSKGSTTPVSRPGNRAILVGGVAIGLAAAFHVWTGIQVAQLGYKRSKAIELNRRLDTQREELADELAGLLRTEHLQLEAERRLGLGQPTAGQVIDLRTKQLASATRRSMR
ncbi:MAG: hypothetical protein P8R42_17435 [Candidatus Binatia bacterium]|nr:hypothetical protein [Candidatus Binatia bacterium]